MKYLSTDITFAEVPDEITLCINITECPHQCDGCHSPELKEDTGKPLTWDSLNALIHINKGITCVAFLGGDKYPKEVDKLAHKVKQSKLKVCWYSGNDSISKDIDIRNFDYIKIGHYDKVKGPLNAKTTNQIMYEVVHLYDDCEETFELEDITNKFWKDEDTSKED